MKMKRACPAILIAFLTIAPIARAHGPEQRTIKGELRVVQGVPILRVWGSPREQGYAQGYLLAGSWLQLFDEYLRETDSAHAYEAASILVTQRFKIPAVYEEELKGILDGVTDKMKGHIIVPSLGRPMEYRDLVAINCIPDSTRMGCSSFAAWGPLTPDGNPIVGRNLDWIYHDALDGQQIVIARVQSGLDPRLSSVMIGWPCFIGCLTGMNSKGVMVSLHDAPGRPVSDVSHLMPRALALREALENARAATAIEDVARVLEKRTSAVGNNVPIAFPYDGRHAPAAVFEYDGDLERDGGVTLRLPESAAGSLACMLACTNHYRKRGEPTACDRYEKIESRLKSARAAGRKIGVPEAWQILKGVEVAGRVFTFHSVVFEPNRMRMHVAFSSESSPAPEKRPVEVNVGELFLASWPAPR